MSRWILIATVLCVVAGLFPAPAQAVANSLAVTEANPCPRARWHKVASRTNDNWPDGHSIILAPEPGMPQALGFDTWQAMYEDAASLDGVISDVGLWHDSNFGSEAANILVQHPAGLVPEGRPFSNSPARWMYFNWSPYNPLGKSTKAYIRIQGTPDHAGPVLYMEIGMDMPADAEFALYVKM